MADLSSLDKAIAFAVRAHAGQLDRDGTPHIHHSLRVMELVRAIVPKDEEMQVAAVLHDVIEDTPFTEEDIRRRFGDRVMRIVLGVTRMPGEVYADFVRRAAQDQDSRLLKVCDVTDNLRRSEAAGDEIAKRYHKALKILSEEVDA